MTASYLKKAVCEDANSFYFTFNNKKCGVDFVVKNSIWNFVMWYGKLSKEYTSYDELVSDKFFDGKSLLELLPRLNIYFG